MRGSPEVRYLRLLCPPELRRKGVRAWDLKGKMTHGKMEEQTLGKQTFAMPWGQVFLVEKVTLVIVFGLQVPYLKVLAS